MTGPAVPFAAGALTATVVIFAAVKYRLPGAVDRAVASKVPPALQRELGSTPVGPLVPFITPPVTRLARDVANETVRDLFGKIL